MAYTITYVGGWVRVTGTDPGTNDVFKQIYDASVLNAWGIETQFNSYMQLAPTNGIIFGNTTQVSVTTISSQNEAVYVAGNIRSEGAASFNTTITFGSYNSGEDKSVAGSKVFWTSTAANDICAVNVIINVYDSVLWDTNIGGSFYQWFRNNTTIIDTTIMGGVAWRFTSSNTTIKRTKLNDSFYGMASETSGQTWDDVRINSCEYGYGGLAVGGEAANLTILNSTTTDVVVAFGGSGNVDLLNSIVDISNVTWIGGASSKVLRKRFTIDAKCIDRNGIGIQGITIEMYQTAEDIFTGTPEFSVITAADGTITQQKITVGTNVYNNTYTNFNDYTIVIKGIGYETKIFTDTISKQKDWIFTMRNINKGIGR